MRTVNQREWGVTMRLISATVGISLTALGSFALSGCQTHQTLRLDIAVDTSGSTVAARSGQPALLQTSRQVLSELEVLGETTKKSGVG